MKKNHGKENIHRDYFMYFCQNFLLCTVHTIVVS